MAFRRLRYVFAADGSAYRRETEQMRRSTERVGDAQAQLDDRFERLARGAAALTAGLTAAAAVLDSMLESADRLDRSAVMRLVGGGLTGGDTADSQAWMLLQDLVGIGPEQAFDSAEALSDALRSRPDTARPVAAAIGVDADELLAADADRRVGIVLDALVARGGRVGEAELEAASELGAGDIRDLASLAALIAADPAWHPDELAARHRSSMPTRREDIESARDALDLASMRAAADAEMSTRPWWSMHHAIRQLPGLGRWQDEQIAREAGWTPLPPIEIRIVDDTLGGVRASQRTADHIADGRTTADVPTPPR